MSQPTTKDLLTTRSHHMDSLNRLRTASKHWDATTATRGEATLCNLMQQVYDIDNQLAQLGCQVEAA